MRNRDPKDRYLEIAARQFAALGYHGVSLAALAAEAGVSKQALLHFFGSKERLYGEVLSRLAGRLLAEIDAAEGHDAADKLVSYFDRHADGVISGGDDARLVVRALLDSDPSARNWPMKAYLDRLTDIAQKTPRWRGETREAALAGIYAVIGAMQYAAISDAALTGMFGKAAQSAIRRHSAEEIRRAARAFVGGFSQSSSRAM